MSEMKSLFSRRLIVAGSAAVVAGPALASGASLAAGSALSGTTPIAKLWAEAQTLGSKLNAHRGLIAEAAARAKDGVPGWMRLGGEANRIAEARYEKLIAILKETPKNAGDLAIFAKVSVDQDITSGARAWAGERLAAAAMMVHA